MVKNSSGKEKKSKLTWIKIRQAKNRNRSATRGCVKMNFGAAPFSFGLGLVKPPVLAFEGYFCVFRGGGSA